MRRSAAHTATHAAHMHAPVRLVRALLGPLRDAAVCDAALASGSFDGKTPREAFRAVVRARGRASEANVALAEALRTNAVRYLGDEDADEGEGRDAGAASDAVARASRALRRAVTSSSSSEVGDGRYDGKFAVQGTLKGTSTRAEDLKVRFWNLWGGSKQCRDVMVKSARDSVYRNPERLERAVLNLDRVAPFVDSPLLLHRAPELLAMETEEIVRRLVKMKDVIPRDVGFVATQTPALLLMEPETLALCARRLAKLKKGTSVVEFIHSDGIETFAALASDVVVDSSEPTVMVV